MTFHFTPGASREFEDFLDALEAELEIPPSRYEAAERSYHSVGDWLNRPESKLQRFDPQVYVQGSFRLGTAIKPLSEKDEYDVDAICEMRRMAKEKYSQSQLKGMLGSELAAYVEEKGMNKPASERRRCWTLHYADGSQFHLDVTPAVPQTDNARWLLGMIGVPPELTGTAIAITDREHANYRRISGDWPRSNPKGYCEWFKSRMSAVHARRKAAMARTRAEVEQIPDYKVRTPLQSAIKLLKRHRDIMFSGSPDEAPISIIITTLSAHAYRGEETTAGALTRVLGDMRDYVLPGKDGVYRIPNPTDPEENFADKWQERPERRIAFDEWLERARTDFQSVSHSRDRREIARVMSRAMGTIPVDRILQKHPITVGGALPVRIRDFGRDLVMRANHRRAPHWPNAPLGQVRIIEATFTRDGFRPERLQSEGRILEKGGDLRFVAHTTVPAPYRVYWQIVNTGTDAERVNGLRGSFEYFEKGGLTRKESTKYGGSHSIECFIVKNGRLAARSGTFVVNIR